jgi:serine/threonine protein kinase
MPPAPGPVLTPPGASLIPPPTALRDIVPGTVLGNTYLIQSSMGTGGMGQVFAGIEIHNQRPVAVKVLPANMVHNDDSMRRFFREARITAALNHPNICRIFHFGTLENRRPYYVMELLDGEPLSARIAREGALRFLDAVEIMMQLLAGLRAAHRGGVIHRDIKPDNIFLHNRADGRQMVKLLDFGLSKDLVPMMMTGEDTTQMTGTGVVMGTPSYLSPEQAMGSRHLDARSDLFSAGVVLYEMVTGRRPFASPTYPGLLARITSEPHKPVTDLRPATPVELQMIVDKALQKEPSRRYQQAADFLNDLQLVRMKLLAQDQE